MYCPRITMVTVSKQAAIRFNMKEQRSDLVSRKLDQIPALKICREAMSHVFEGPIESVFKWNTILIYLLV